MFYLLPFCSICVCLQGDRSINPNNTQAVAGTFKEEIVYYTKCVEELKTRHQWRMLMKDVIMRDVAVTPNTTESHSLDPTAACVPMGGTLSDARERTSHSNEGSSSNSNSSSSNSSSSNSTSSSSSNSYPGVDSSDSTLHRDDVDEEEVIIVDNNDSKTVLKEPLPPHKVVMRKRGDQEVRIELYGIWQTEPYTVR